MKVHEILNETVFRTDTTEMPTYDNMMQNPEYFEEAKNTVWELVNMSPTEYINIVANDFKTTRQSLLNGRDSKVIKEYADQMKSGGKPFPILLLDYRGKRLSQEGLHRSFAAEDAGIKEVPVLIVRLKDESRGRIY